MSGGLESLGIESLIAKMTGNRKCYASSSIDVALANGEIGRGSVFCEENYGHALPHRTPDGAHTWPSRREILER